ncbi:MAG: shikimate dehydrogenase [Alphaproteobacteria bacterium]|nr:shikimate dehydrogenase [Alphaproteobacteria bacterium]
MKVSSATRLFAVVGDPVAHSLSPLIHNRWLEEAGVDAVYAALRLRSDTPAADLRAIARTGFSGLNVTLPHKGAALAAASGASAAAQRIGAANTLTLDPGVGWLADNTDVDGLSLALHHSAGPDVGNRKVLLIGAGGAARAAVDLLGRSGSDLSIVNRSLANARTLVAELAPDARAHGMDDFTMLAREADLIINSASLGHADAGLPSLPPGKGRVFLDLSYGAAARDALAGARDAGWTAHDGLRMLVGQAAATFFLWFNFRPDVEGALAACREKIGGPA